MGASMSSTFSFGKQGQGDQTSTQPSSTASTAAAAKKPPQSSTSSAPLKTPSRRSRRVTKSDPTKIIIPSNPTLPTPQLKHTPLSAASRKTYTSTKLTPASRKSSRFTKFKMPKYNGAPKYSAKLSYEVDEMVYCWDKKLLYEARVMKREGNKYRVHFVGFKKDLDRWYATDDMMGKDPKSNRFFREMWQKVQDNELGRHR